MITGRQKEIELLNTVLNDNRSHFLAVYGRRRIGKTFLIREFFGGRFTFMHSGLFEGKLNDQLYAFSSSLKDAGYQQKKAIHNWLEAFDALKELVLESKEHRKVIFIDELSWMDTPKSKLIMALEHFWNGFASSRNDIILIVCASATSWMLSNVVHNKGGLYNRLTEQLHIQSFSLKDCEDYINNKNIALNREQIAQYYMIFGGVPFYWDFLQKGYSLQQNIDNILFSREAPLKNEFDYLYASVFKKPQVYIRIVETLATKKVGMTREEIIQRSGIINSGDLSHKLEELESCGFIRVYYAFGMKKKNAVYQLIDSFTLFYYQFLKSRPTDEHFWSNQINTPAVNTWAGLAFERLCLLHINQMKQKLGITGIISEVNSFYCQADPDKGITGSQIDLLIVRKDQVINLCEMKYSSSEYTVTEKTDRSIRNKINDLRISSGTKYAIHPTIVTTYGLLPNSYSNNIQSVITLDDLFRQHY